MPTKEDIAYATGLFDGEGTVTFIHDKRYGSYALRLSMSSTDLGLVKFMQEMFEGSLHIAADKRNPKYQHHWATQGPRAFKALVMMEPYMREKNKVARTKIVISEYPSVMGKNLNGRDTTIRAARNTIAEKVRAIV